MIVVVWILVVAALALQLAAAVVAIRLIWVTGRKWAWALVATAIFLMVFRRMVALVSLLAGAPSAPLEVLNESLGLAISLCMFVGLAWIVPVFHEFRRSQQTITHLNGVLHCMRAISQLIAREKDRDRLLQGVCDRLTEAPDVSACLAGAARFVISCRDRGGVRPGGVCSSRFAHGWSGASFPVVCGVLLETPGGAIFGSGAADCGDCPLRVRDVGGRALAVQLSTGDGDSGVLVTCLPTSVPTADEEKALLEEAATRHLVRPAQHAPGDAAPARGEEPAAGRVPSGGAGLPQPDGGRHAAAAHGLRAGRGRAADRESHRLPGLRQQR